MLHLLPLPIQYSYCPAEHNFRSCSFRLAVLKAVKKTEVTLNVTETAPIVLILSVLKVIRGLSNF
jgi:hypothetical protein